MSPTSYRTALPRVIRPKRFAPTAKIIIARFAAPVNPCGKNFPIHYKGRGRQRALYGPRRSFPRPHHKVAAPRPPSAEKARDRKTVQTKNQPRGRSLGPAHITKSRHRARRAPKGPQNRPDAKPASSPPAPHFARKRRGHPAAAAPSFAGDQALILRMAIAVTCVGAALVPAVALS